ncbi:adenosine kinase-like [Teleopsis dalmanni]|uniref:adenosine kinase-like n=1 Tax=Teleopsis dalmanni TaxID=139649 RepID=UPI0018CF4843|nr:adenosine kinase-like [Teleopsis dalmanni]
MEYLQQFYEKIFGDSNGDSGWGAGTPRKVVAFGNVLLDRTVQIADLDILDRFQLSMNAKGELSVETLNSLTAEICESSNCITNPGGSSLNTVRILKKLGTEALFFGAVGDDKYAEELRDRLQDYEIDARIETITETPTGQCVCLVYEDKTALYANIGASAGFSIDLLKRAEKDENKKFLRSIERKQILYIEGFFIPKREDVCEYIVRNYIRERRRLAINLSAPYIVQRNYEQLLYLARNAYFIFGNVKEFEAFMEKMGCSSLEKMAEELIQSGLVKIIVITKGDQGVQVISNYIEELGEPGPIVFNSYNAPRVENVLDTTGAGDAFVAGFLHAWLEKRSLSECIRVATDVAAQVVTQIGCNLPE